MRPDVDLADGDGPGAVDPHRTAPARGGSAPGPDGRGLADVIESVRSIIASLPGRLAGIIDGPASFAGEAALFALHEALVVLEDIDGAGQGP